MKTVRYTKSGEIPFVAEADVIVIGGGPGGLGAAVIAARAGARTVLVERYGYMGGMASSGEVQPFMWNHAAGHCLDRPVYVEWVRRMQDYLSPQLKAKIPHTEEVTSGEEHMIAKDVAMLAMEDLCLEAGVRLLYHHWLVDVVLDGRRIAAAVLVSKSGFAAAVAPAFVDCTGDADLATLAGCPFEIGGPSGHCQPMTLCFKLSHVDRSRMPGNEEIHRRYSAAKERGDIHCPRENVLQFGFHDADVVHFNTTRVVQKSGVSGVELSDAEVEARHQLREYLAWLRRDVAGFEQAEVRSIAHHIGVRETRRIRGMAYLTRDDFVRSAKFPDAIARVQYPIDIHNPTGTGTEIVEQPQGEYYEIPYGCVVPQGVDNLTVGGRPISVDHAIHSSMRVMPPACSIGQAAGLAAAMAARRGVRPADIDGREVRAGLREKGAYL